MNKIKSTLLFFPLIIINPTTYFYFAIICGLKGNEWILEKNIKDDTETFHKKQKVQASILFLLVPVITIISLFATSTFLKYGENYNIFTNKLSNISSFITQKATSNAFERIEYLDDQYNFYVNMEIWNSMTKNERSELYQFAIYRVLDDNNISIFDSVPTEIINKTVIYDSINNHRLFYCQIPEEYGKSISSKRRYLKKVIQRFSSEF